MNSTGIDNARNVISNYCFRSCGALCCKKGYIVLDDEKVVELVVGAKRDEFIKNKKLKKMESGQYSLKIEGGCPSLGADNKCTIHTNPLRPRLCKDCPIFVFGKNLVTAPYCPAVIEGELDSEFEKLKKEGFKII